jgi:hypothetical protein
MAEMKMLVKTEQSDRASNANDKPESYYCSAVPKAAVVMSRAEQYRRLARDFHFMARDLPPGENRSVLLKMAEECDHLADRQKRATGSAQGKP